MATVEERVRTVTAQVLKIDSERIKMESNFTVDLGAVVAVNLAGQQVQGTALIALIGRDILSRCHFTYGGSGGFFSLSV